MNVCVCVCVVCQLSVTVSHICCARRQNLPLPENGQDIWPKYVGVVYNKNRNIVQIFGDEICIFHVLFGLLHHLVCLVSRY
jgi:hypothetical protein